MERLFGERAARSAEQAEAVEEGAADPEREAELERRREAGEAIPEQDGARLREFCERLEGLRKRAALLSLDSLVDETAATFDYDLAVLQRDRGRRRWANVRKLIGLARSYEEASGRDLAGFLGLLRARAERDDREPEAQTEIEGHDGVRVMTVHNAKGLEFGVVAVADLGRDLGAGGFAPAFRARADAGGEGIRVGVRLARAGGPSLRLFELEDLHAEASEEESAEDRRLAYVAATRAERRLVLSGVLDPAALERCAKQDVPPPRASVQLRLLTALGIGIGEDGLSVADEPRLPGAEVAIVAGGSEAKVRIPAPAALQGMPAPNPGELAVRLHRPAPGLGEELLAMREADGGAEAAPPVGRSPLAQERGGTGRARAPAGHLSNAALELYDRCGYRFYVERLLGLRAPAVNGGEGALAFGSAVHALLEWSARNRWLAPPRERVEAALARSGLDPDPARTERAADLVAGWLASPLREELAGSRARLAPEAPFLLDVGGAVVRGTLDLLVSPAGETPLVVDYKTNALGDRPPAEHMSRYETQRDLYALATAGAVGAAEVRTAFVFLERPGEPVIREHDASSLAATRERLEGLVAGIAAGEFEVTEFPHRELCQDCPAQPRLCVHPPELTMAESPPPAGAAAEAAPAADR